MRQNISGSSEEKLISYGCAAHILNLLALDIVGKSSHKKILEQVTRTIKYFRNHHAPKSWYEKAGGSALILHTEVRWNTYCDSLNSYLKNWSILAKVSEEKREHPNFDKEIGKIIMNFVVKRGSEDIANVLKPIAKAVDECQKNKTKLADCVLCWKILENILIGENLIDNEDKNSFLKRYKFCLTPSHYAAFLLSPKMMFQDITLSSEENDMAIKFLEENFNLTFMSLFYKYKGNVGPFSRTGSGMSESVISSMTDSEWWISFQAVHPKYISDRNLANILQLTSASCSTAGIERIFSKFGLIHSDLRNKLGIEKAAKLVFISQQLNQPKNNEKI